MAAQNPYQATYSILDLVAGTTPSGSEPFETIQNGQSVRLTLSQVAALIGLPPTIRLPVFAASIPILTTDIEVGVSTVTSAVVCPLPSAALWAATVPGGALGLDLVIIDRTGNAPAHNVTFALNGGDTFLQGVAPVITSPFGSLRLRPYGSPTITGWYIKGLG